MLFPRIKFADSISSKKWGFGALDHIKGFYGPNPSSSLSWRMAGKLGKVRLRHSIFSSNYPLNFYKTPVDAIRRYYRRGLGVSFQLRRSRQSRAIASIDAGAHKLLARRRRYFNIQITRRQIRPVYLKEERFAGVLQLIKFKQFGASPLSSAQVLNPNTCR